MKKRIYTEAELNAELDRLEEILGEKMDARFRRIFTLLNNAGLFNAFCELCAETPDEKSPDYEWFVAALDEAKRSVAYRLKSPPLLARK